MIVDPDFLDHWRTRMLVDTLVDEMAPLYVLRVWAHCQSRKSTSFAMPASGLKALCRYKGDAQALETAMVDAGFIVRNGDALEAPKWGEHNAKLVANWTNGPKGGRPPKPTANPPETQQEPKTVSIKPTGTQPEPIREDKTREDQNTHPSGTAAGRLSRVLREKGVKGVTPHHPLLMSWVQNGVTEQIALEAVQLARVNKPPPDTIPPAYLDKVIASLVGTSRPQSAVRAPPWFMSSSGIEAKGKELGVTQGKDELFPYFRARVLKAAGVTEEQVRQAEKDAA